METLFDLHPYDEEGIATAKKAILSAFREDESRPIEILFSGGKDSLLVALLTWEVIQENKLSVPVKIHTDLTGYERNGGEYEKNILDSVSSCFNIDVFTPPPLQRYSVRVLGSGVQPLNSFHFRDCTKNWKTRLTPRGGFFFSGVRRAESRKRALMYKDTSPFQWFKKEINTLAPCVHVGEFTTWEYLRRNVYKIGVDINYVLDAYASDCRHGCWCCHFGKEDNLPPFEREIKRLARYWGRWYLDNRAERWRPPFREKKERPRATLKYKKIIYNQVQELQAKYNVRYIRPVCDSLIKEYWNFQEHYLTMGEDDERDPWNKILYKEFEKVKEEYIEKWALRPDLIRACYEPGVRPGTIRLKQKEKFCEYRNGIKTLFDAE